MSSTPVQKSSTPVQESYIFRRNTQPTISSPATTSSPLLGGINVNWKNLFIIALVLLLIISFLGINILYYFADGISKILSQIWALFAGLLGTLGYSTGYALDKTSETVATVAKTGIDIADGTVDDVAKLLMQSSKGSKINGVAKSESGSDQKTGVQPIDSSNPIQLPISAGKQNWCLVGEDQGARSCVLVGEYDKCMSGQIFPDKQRCIMPSAAAGGIPIVPPVPTA